MRLRTLLLAPEMFWPAMRMLDVVAVAGTGLAAYWARFAAAPDGFAGIILLSTALIALNLSSALRLYDERYRHAGLYRRARIAWQAWALTCATVMLIGWATKTTGLVSRLWIGTWFLSGFAALGLVRLAEASLIARARQLGFLTRKIALVVRPGESSPESLARIIRHLRSNLTYQPRALYVQEGARAALPGPVEGVPAKGNIDALSLDLTKGEIDEIVVVASDSSTEVSPALLDLVRRLPVRCSLLLDVQAPAGLPQTVRELGGLPALQIATAPLTPAQLATKRLFDLAVSFGILLLAAPLMLLMALAIKAESRGPVFFRQPRFGFAGESFVVYKFRTMREEASDLRAETLTRRDDPRITRVGRVLRRTSLDELPQLFNVLRGEMSLVGPRPHAAAAKAGGTPYEEAVRQYHARHRVKPGITGWAQVNGWRGSTDTVEEIAERVAHDLWYVDNWSLGLDIRILFMTLFSLTGKRTY